MLAVQEANKLLTDAKIPQIDGIYSFNIPAEMVTNVTDTFVLITDANLNTDTFGSNDFYSVNRMIEIQIYFELHPDFDPEQLLIRVMKLFKHNGWLIGEERGFNLDIDTSQLYVTFYVKKEEKTLN